MGRLLWVALPYAGAARCSHVSDPALNVLCHGCANTACEEAHKWGCAIQAGASFLEKGDSASCIAQSLGHTAQQHCSSRTEQYAEVCRSSSLEACVQLAKSDVCVMGSSARSRSLVQEPVEGDTQPPPQDAEEWVHLLTTDPHAPSLKDSDDTVASPRSRSTLTETTTTLPPGARVYPEGGVALPNGKPDPCDDGYEQVKSLSGKVFCFPRHEDHVVKGCVSGVDCPKGYYCEGEGTEEGGICTFFDYGVSPTILESTCLHDDDCGQSRVCRRGPLDDRNVCVMEGQEIIPCSGTADCPEDMSCRGSTAVQEGGMQSTGDSICVGAPVRPSYVKATRAHFTAEFAQVPKARSSAELVQEAPQQPRVEVIRGMNVSEDWVPKSWTAQGVKTHVRPPAELSPKESAPVETIGGMVVSSQWIPRE
mmetsp:Transcript_24801/g.60151  ORF Transcript_24801/g.60151 Transcript_24801/m.60151 type:complete len:422 (+) Transcript_24801:104-1369(+)